MSPRMRRIALLVAATAGPTLCLAATDAERLAALHQKVIRAHQESDVELLLEDSSADYVVASRGDVTRPTIADRRARLGSYLGRTRFSEYRDLREPIVTVSADGTLGWVMVQVHAVGEQTGADGETHRVEFTSAWIELYQKRDGRWLRVGNVSNFKE